MRIVGLYNRIIKSLSNLCITLSIIALLFNPINVKADSVVSNLASSYNCHTQGRVDLLTKPHSHSCIPDAFSTMVIASFISPFMYLPMMLKMRMSYDQINGLKGNCERKNRADNKKPTITFAMCSDWQLIKYNLLVNIGQGKIGSDLDYNQFYDVYEDMKVGDSGGFIDLPVGSPASLPYLPYKIIRDNDRICAATWTMFGTLIPVGCKYMKEPYPTGLYKQFFETGITVPDNLSGNVSKPKIPKDVEQFFNCAKGIGGCAQNATVHSQTMLPISSVIIECIRATLLSTLISDTTCGISNGQIQYGGSLFHTFQGNMQRAVMAFLTLYVMFTGFKLILGQGEVPPAGELIMYAVKLILVIYFSVGININGQGRFDGMVQWVFPLLLEAANQMAGWIANATPSGLCVFPLRGIEYGDGMSRLALWDTLDCKVMHYLGFDTFSSMFLGGASGDNFGNSVPPYIFLLIPALISGQINLAMLALSYPLVVMSVAAYLVTTFSVCLIAITVLAVLAPIYVPFALFKQTEGYFQAWYQLMISFTLQPVVIVGFMTVMFAVFDQGFYTGCEFEGIGVQANVGNTKVMKQMYILKVNKEDYTYKKNYSTCKSSLGWILNQPLANIANGAVDASSKANPGKKNVLGLKTIYLPPPGMGFSDYQAAYGMLNGIQQVAGIFFGYAAFIGGINKQMIVSLFACILMLYLMRELSGQLSEFAADIAGGVSLKSTTISPRSMTGDKLKEKMEDHQDNKKADDLKKREGVINKAEGDKKEGGKREGGVSEGGDTKPKTGDSSASSKPDDSKTESEA